MLSRLTTKRKILLAALFTTLLSAGFWGLDHINPTVTHLREIKPKERIMVYMDIEMLIDGKRGGPQPQATALMGEKCFFAFSLHDGVSLVMTTRPFQVEGMSSQEVLIEVEIFRLNVKTKAKEIIATSTVKARNRMKSNLLIQQSAGTQESFQMMVTPYFDPIKEDVAIK